MTWEKRIYVVNLVSLAERKSISSESSRRTQSIAYFLNKNSNRLQVCRRMFLSTLGLKEKMVRNWIRKSEKHGTQLSPQGRKSLRIQKKRCSIRGQRNNIRRDFLENWLTGLPKVESHYCRRDSRKLYFENVFSSYKHIYEFYLSECETNVENKDMKLSYYVVVQTTKKLNYSIFKPKKDECDVCVDDPSGFIYFKTNITDEYELLPHRTKACIERIIPARLYT